MDFQVKGIIVAALPMKTGVSKQGREWKRCTYVIQYENGDRPKRVVFDVLGDKIDQFGIRMNEVLTVHLNIDAKEYNGRMYNNIDAWKVEREPQQVAQQQPIQTVYPERKPAEREPQQMFDDLPFS